MNKNRSDQKMSNITDLSKENTKRTPELREKLKNREKIMESVANSLLSRDYKEIKKTSQLLFTIL